MGFVALIYTHACITPFAAKAGGIFRSLLTYQQKDTIPIRTQPSDSSVQRVDTFRLKRSADTLDAPIRYEAEDSAVVLVKDKKVLLYGKTKTNYTDMVLTAPQVQVDQRTQIITAVRSVDSTGTTLEAAYFKTGDSEMTNDTILYNFKSQVGVTKKTYTQALLNRWNKRSSTLENNFTR